MGQLIFQGFRSSRAHAWCPRRCLPVTPARDYSAPMTAAHIVDMGGARTGEAAFEEHFRTLLSMDDIMQMQQRQEVGAIRCVPRAHDVAI